MNEYEKYCFECKIAKLKKENKDLFWKLKSMQEENDLEALIYELQDQHQQDCIRYNDMRTAFLKTVDELAMLRKQFGVGQ